MEMGPVWRTITFRLNFHLNFHLKQEGTCFTSPVRPAGELMNAGGSLSDQDAVEIEVLRIILQTPEFAPDGVAPQAVFSTGGYFGPTAYFLQFHRGADP
jgi:hypothetical protein